MASSKHRRIGSNSGQIQVDSGPDLKTEGGDQNITETDALDGRKRPHCRCSSGLEAIAGYARQFSDCCRIKGKKPTWSRAFDPAAQYKMNHKRRGVALIFNHERFYWHLTLPDRRGTHADRENLKRSLTELGFEVICFDDLKAEDVLQNIYEVSMDNHSDADCFVCVFLSHGEDNHVYAYDAKIKIQTVTNMFRGNQCPSLAGKPKMFIIQACRGDKHDDPVVVTDAVDSITDKSNVNETEVDAAAVYTLPAGADFLMCYSVAEGYYSHRETVNGSWYIQDLCEMIRKYGSSLEFTELLTLVNRKVAHRKVEVCKDVNALRKKQIPCFASMLTKKLHFQSKSK